MHSSVWHCVAPPGRALGTKAPYQTSTKRCCTYGVRYPKLGSGDNQVFSVELMLQTKQTFRTSRHRLIAAMTRRDYRQVHPTLATVIVRGSRRRSFFPAREVKNECATGRPEYKGTREPRVSNAGGFLAAVTVLASMLDPPHCKPQRSNENLSSPA